MDCEEVEVADIFEAATKKSRIELIDWIHDSCMTRWELLLEKAVKGKEEEEVRNQLVAKILELIGTKILLQPESDAPSKEGEEEDATDGNGTNGMSELRQKEVKILAVTCNEKFLDSVKNTVGSWSAQRKKHGVLGELLAHLQLFCGEVLERIPLLGMDLLINLICAAIGAVVSSAGITQANPELLGEFTALQRKIQEISKLFEKKKEEHKKDYSEQFDQLLQRMEPLDNFRDIPVVPTLQELIGDPKPFLRPNNVIGPYRSPEHYLDVHFRLLREDFVRPLRNAVKEFMKNKKQFVRNTRQKTSNREQDTSIRVYPDVTFLRSERSPDSHAENCLFSLPKKLVTKVKWEKSKRLLPGSLVMLTADLCKTALFAVTVQTPVDPRKKSTNGSDSRRKELARGILRLAIETGKDLVKEGQSYLMFECDAFFEAYRYNLGILQTITFLENEEGSHSNFLNKVIVQASSDVGPPAYLESGGNLHILVSNENYEYSMSVSPFHLDTWPAEEIQKNLRLDPDQYEALKTALTSELAVIQGPPGTGKTYVGLQIVKTLLYNKVEEVLPASPLLVVCYTNHALDQFLELLLQELPSLSVVRVGGQSKSEKLQNYTLSHLRRRIYNRPYSRREPMPLQKKAEVLALQKVRHLEGSLTAVTCELTSLSNPGGIFNFKCMKVTDRLKKCLPGTLWNALLESSWLGLRESLFLDPDFQVQDVLSHFFAVKPNSKKKPQKGKVRPPSKSNGEKVKGSEEEEEESEYNMDELLEHRFVSDDPWKSSSSAHKGRSVAERNTSLYLDKCCSHCCTQLARKLDSQRKIANKQHMALIASKKTAGLRNAQEQLTALNQKWMEYGNRAKLISTIFELYTEDRLELPQVDTYFCKAEEGGGRMVINENIVKYPIRLRWAIYFKVVEIAREMTRAYREEVAGELEKARKSYVEERNKLDGFILRGADIIGMTTTGAAKMHELLEVAKPEVVIVEEAAEILESHIVTSLTENCKHLILIGDHLQLRPSANIYELWKKYRLNVSLFERMILNGIPLCSLKTQHRMRPEISNLIIGPIYEELHDHPKVHEYPHVKGIRKNMFFINHHERESTDADLLSKSNRHEAEFLVALCEYLLKQGYEHNKITILTTYTGQMFLLRKIFPESCRGVRITCVDNFQGEENDIILLSLVRSNEEDKVGFVAIDNRICVALSRARHGLYVIGNMDGMVVASKTWKKIEKKLKEGGNIGPALELVCKQHGKVTEVKTGKDFVPLGNGGCDQKCEALLQCGHACPQKCHALDATHKLFQCFERCVKKCENDHQCVVQCWSECPRCKVLMSKSLPCGHQETVACFQDVTRVLCETPVLRKLACEHEVEVECHVDGNTLQCKVQVEKTLFCGHSTTMDCSLPLDQTKCQVENERILNCGHPKRLRCYQSMDTVSCCVSVEKMLKCGHKATTKCYKRIEEVSCKESVKRILRCGHSHTSSCSWSPPDEGVQCQQVVDIVMPGCSHSQKVACFQSTKAKCTTKCEKILSCGHSCTLPCHVGLNEDPNHVGYKCEKKCDRSCNSGHPCPWNHACSKECLPCNTVITLKLPCGHEGTTECYRENEGVNKCLKKVRKELPCGHQELVACHVAPEDHQCTFQIVKCEKTCDAGHPCTFNHACYEKCPPCEKRVEKTLPCGHSTTAELPCYDDGKHQGGLCQEGTPNGVPLNGPTANSWMRSVGPVSNYYIPKGPKGTRKKRRNN